MVTRRLPNTSASCAKRFQPPFRRTCSISRAADIVTQILNFRASRADRCAKPSATTRATQSPGGQGDAAAKSRQFPGSADAPSSSRRSTGPAFYAERSIGLAQAQLGLNANMIATNLKYQPELIRAGLAEFLDRSDLRDSLLHRGPRPPSRKVASLNDLANTPCSPAWYRPRAAVIPGLLFSNVATLKRSTVPTNTNQTNIQPIYDVYASVQGPRSR